MVPQIFYLSKKITAVTWIVTAVFVLNFFRVV